MSNIGRLLRTNLKLRHLQVLVVLDDFRNISKAAQVLHLSQPAISRTLSEIELLSESTLFDRGSHGTQPTAQGALLVQYARRTLADLDRVGDDIAALQQGTGGRVHVGAHSFADADLLPRSIARMKRDHPETIVRVSSGFLEPLLTRLRLGEIDFVVARLTLAEGDSSLSRTELYQEHVVVVVGNANPLLSREPLSWEELAHHPWVVPAAGTSSRSRLEAIFEQEHVALPSNLIEAESFLLLVTLLDEMKACAMLSSSVAARAADMGILSTLRIAPPAIDSSVGIIRSKATELSPRASQLVAHIEAVAKARETPR